MMRKDKGIEFADKERGIIPMLVTFIVVILLGLGVYAYSNIKEKKADDTVAITIPVTATSTAEVATTTASTSAATASSTSVTFSGLVKKAYTKGERYFLDIDEVTFEKCQTATSGTCAINKDVDVKTYEVSADARIKIQGTYNVSGVIQQGYINWNEFKNIFTNTEDYRKNNAWDVTVKGNTVVDIKEHKKI
jgi:hypothetical protein